MNRFLLLLLFAPYFVGCSRGDSAKGTYGGKPWRSLTGYNLETSDVAFSPNGKWLAVAGINSATVIVKEKGRVRRLEGQDYAVKVWDTATWKLTKSLRLDDTIGHVVFSPDNKLLAASAGNNLTIYTTSDWKITHTIQLQQEFSPLAFSPNGDVLAAGNRLLSTTTGKMLRQIPTTGDAYSVSFSPDNQTLATGCWSGKVQLWDWNTAKEIKVIQPAINTAASSTLETLISFSPDGKLLATSCWGEANVQLWDALTGQQIRSLTGGKTIFMGKLGNAVSGVDAVAFSLNSKKVVTASASAMKLWDVATGQILHTFHGESDRFSAYHVQFSPDGKLVAAASRGIKVDLWKVP